MIRDDKTAVDGLIPLIEVMRRLELGIPWLEVSWLTLQDLVTSGEFEVCDINGQTVDRFDITEYMHGLWVFESELARFIDRVNSFH